MEEKKPRWEVKYEKFVSEEPIKDRIEDIQRSIENMDKYVQATTGLRASQLQEEIENLKKQKVTGNFKTREEYEKAVEEHKAVIASKENEVKELEEQAKNEKLDFASKQNAKLEDYKNYEKNKDKIKNILEYRNSLKAKLEKLPKDNKQEMEQKKAEIDNTDKILAEQENRLDELIKYVNSNQKAKDILEKQEELSITAAVVRNLKEQKGRLDLDYKDMEKNQKSYQETSAPNKETYERKIAKCNLIAANLLKGKDLDDITIKVESEDKKYTSPTGKLKNLINKVKQSAKSKSKQNSSSMVQVSEFEKKHPTLAKIGNFFKNIKNKIVNAFAEQENEEEEQQLPQDIQDSIQGTMVDIKENDLLKEIAEKGAAKAFRDKQAEYRKAAADRYARDFGGRYEGQDGATEHYEPTSRAESLKKEDEYSK